MKRHCGQKSPTRKPEKQRRSRGKRVGARYLVDLRNRLSVENTIVAELEGVIAGNNGESEVGNSSLRRRIEKILV